MELPDDRRLAHAKQPCGSSLADLGAKKFPERLIEIGSLLTVGGRERLSREVFFADQATVALDSPADDFSSIEAVPDDESESGILLMGWALEILTFGEIHTP